MRTEPNCILCQINQEIRPHYTVLANNYCNVILDIRPITAGHLLIISRTHVSHLHELPKEEADAVFTLTRRLTQQMADVTFGVNDCNIIINNGPIAGQHLPHVHVHLIPRRAGDHLRFYWRLMTRFINPFSSMNRAQNLEALQQRWQHVLEHSPPIEEKKEDFYSNNH